jgi:tetratricopeptide (TPR) repeat protein
LDLLAFLLVAALAGPSLVQDTADFPSSDAWKETWRELDTLSSTAPGSANRRRMLVELDAFQARHERSARKRQDRPEAFRARVLAAQLARVKGTPFQPVPEPGVSIAWLPGEGWIAAQVTAPGATRLAAIGIALSEAKPSELGERLNLAFEWAEADARELQWDDSYAVAILVHETIRSTPAANLPPEYQSGAKAVGLLARVLRMRGEYAEARKILEQGLESTLEPGERMALLAESGRDHLAAGEESLAARDLGEALALGSPDASGLLARSALSEHASARARALYRSLASSPARESSTAAALRGYGLSLLLEAPSTRNPTDTRR